MPVSVDDGTVGAVSCSAAELVCMVLLHAFHVHLQQRLVCILSPGRPRCLLLHPPHKLALLCLSPSLIH
jgi:hypothetical protein